MSLVRLGSKAAYQVLHSDRTVAFFDAASGERIEDPHEGYARSLAQAFSGIGDGQIVSVRPVTQFGPEYGFINKILPVVRVEYNDANHTRYFVEPVAGILALALGDRKRLESYTFDYLHKWHFLDFAGQKTRDVAMMLFVLTQSLVAASGLWMFTIGWRPRKRTESARRSLSPTSAITWD